jgi:hypothetical protein
MNIYDQIIERLQQGIDRPSINKFYRFSIEELQDNPDRLKEIADYLSQHQDKYDDFEINTWIDEETFRPVFMLKLYLSKEFATHIVNTRIEKTIEYFQQQKTNQ